jgi:hypothetical protein
MAQKAYQEKDATEVHHQVERLYNLISFSIAPILFIGRLVSLFKLRKVVLKNEQAQQVEKMCEGCLSKEQTLKYNCGQWTILIAALAIFIVSIQRSYVLANDKLYTAVAVLCYYEVAVEPDLLLLVLYHLAQVYESLRQQLDCSTLQRVSAIQTPSAAPTAERFNACADKWLQLRALCSEIGNAYAFYWIPFLAFVTSNLSFLLFQLSDSSDPFWRLPPHRLYLILPAGVLVTILVCSSGQMVSDGVSFVIAKKQFRIILSNMFN